MAVDESKIREKAAEVAASSGLDIVDIEFHGSAGKSRMLRIFIEKAEHGAVAGVAPKGAAAEHPEWLAGVTHEDCENFSREFSTILDIEELVPGGAYTLEVSSPGLDRKLSKPRDFERFTGSLVKVMTREPIDGNRHWQGRLEQFADGKLKLRIEAGKKKKGKPAPQEREIEVELGNVEKANLLPEF